MNVCQDYSILPYFVHNWVRVILYLPYGINYGLTNFAEVSKLELRRPVCLPSRLIIVFSLVRIVWKGLMRPK